ncbi:MAG: methyl-accepting chemotaxis protein [Clostridium sp.]|uniref:methyl-accepting chemotaxis protein n=1 Tax=Clostridium sp. TaxID=1506 RepID=UPI003D6C84E0
MKKVNKINDKKSTNTKKQRTKGKTKSHSIKLINLILIILILSVIFLGLVGTIGQITVKKVNNNTDIIYNDQLVSIINIGEINNNFLTIRNNVSRGIESPLYYKFEKDIKASDGQIKGILEQYKKSSGDKYQTEHMEKIKKNYNDYMLMWEDIKIKKKEGNAALTLEVIKINTLEKNIITSIDGLIKYNKLAAEKLKINSSKIYKDGVKMLYIINIAAIFILTALSISIIKIIKHSLKELIEELNFISQGDFTANINISDNNEFGIMKKSLAKMIDNVSSTLKSVTENSDCIVEQSYSLNQVSQEMNLASKQIATSMESVAEGSISQSGNLLNIDETIIKLRHEIASILTYMEQLGNDSKTTENIAEKGNEEIRTLMVAMGSINSSFNSVNSEIAILSKKIQQINSISNMIKSISDKTNLLALNAAIEAARAGDAGKGFAIVAEAIRGLAEQSKDSSKEINILVEDISLGADNVVNITQKVNGHLKIQNEAYDNTVSSFKKIANAVGDIQPKIKYINERIIGLSSEQDELIVKVDKVNLISKENSELSQQITASSEEMTAAADEVSCSSQLLSTMAVKMNEQINKFKLSN